MTTEAQINANRINAQESTGPRTPEGKATVAHNAIRHGLLAREVVIQGEDPGEFALYREGLLAELAPAGATESVLAERIVGLAWRLRRAERLHGAAFDRLQEQENAVWSDRDQAWVYPKPTPRDRESESLAMARLVVQDFRQTRVLDRLLMYERRIEQSLYRTMAELRNMRRLREAGAGAGRTTEGVRLQGSGVSDLTAVTSSATTNVAEAPEPSCPTNPLIAGIEAQRSGIDSLNSDPRPLTAELSCETKPICEEASSVKCQVSSEQGQAVSSPSLPTSNITLETAAEPQSCETKPISARVIKDGEGYRPIFRRRR